MPPRFVYWTIIAGGLPTAFRSAEREELMPTFQRLREKHPDAEMKYFAQGKLWDSPEQAREAREAQRRGEAPREGGERRGRDWRPGGEHRDPRQKYKDQKKERNLRWREQKFDRKNRPPREKPQGAPLRAEAKPAGRDRPTGPAAPKRPPFQSREGGPKREWRERPSGPAAPKRDWRDRPAGPASPKRPPFQSREGWRDRPSAPKGKGGWRNQERNEPKRFDGDERRPDREPHAPSERDRGPAGPKRPPFQNREGGRPPFRGAGGKRPFQGRGGPKRNR